MPMLHSDMEHGTGQEEYLKKFTHWLLMMKYSQSGTDPALTCGQRAPCRDCKCRELITMNVGRGPYVQSPQVGLLSLLHIFLLSPYGYVGVQHVLLIFKPFHLMCIFNSWWTVWNNNGVCHHEINVPPFQWQKFLLKVAKSRQLK